MPGVSGMRAKITGAVETIREVPGKDVLCLALPAPSHVFSRLLLRSDAPSLVHSLRVDLLTLVPADEMGMQGRDLTARSQEAL